MDTIHENKQQQSLPEQVSQFTVASWFTKASPAAANSGQYLVHLGQESEQKNTRAASRLRRVDEKLAPESEGTHFEWKNDGNDSSGVGGLELRNE